MREMGIGSASFAYDKLVESAPKKGMLAEIQKNAAEAVGSTRVVYTSCRVGQSFKSLIINDGDGMDDDTLYGLSNIMNDYNSNNGKTSNNFNNGIRIMGLPNNENGLVFISKKDGEIRNIRLGLNSGVHVAFDNDAKYNLDFGEDYGFNNDWTALLLLGNSVKHPTASKPYGDLTGKYPFEEQMLLRFFNPLIDVFFDKKKFISLSERYKDSIHYPIKVDDDVTIHYRLTDNTSHEPVNGILSPQKELFAVAVGKGSNRFASSAHHLYGALGAYAVASELSIIVEVSEKYNKQTIYRDALMDEATGDIINLHSFSDDIVRYLPEELRTYIDEKSDRKSERELKSKTEEFARDMLDELGLDLEALVNAKDGEHTRFTKEPSKKSKRKNINPAPSKKSGTKPTPAERKKGMPEIKSEFLEDLDLMYADFKKYELGYVEGDYAYFNPNHPYVMKAAEFVRIKIPTVNEEIVKNSFISFVAKEYTMALPYELPKEYTGAVLLATATSLLGNGTFVKAFVNQNNK